VSSGGFFDERARSGSGMSRPDGSQTGTIEYASQVVTYECRDGKVVRFERTPR